MSQGEDRDDPKDEPFATGRVTLDFTGPPLSLPGDDEGGEPAYEETAPAREPEGAAPPLELDTSELGGLESPEAETGEPEGAAPPLELDTRELEDEAHDAWTEDRLRRRSTPPPVASVPVELSPSSAPPPAEERGSRASGGDALGLVDERQRPSGEVDLASEMADRYALDDFTGALRAAELLLGRNPDDPAAQRYAQSSRQRLEQIYSSRLGSLNAAPQVAVPEGEIRWLGLDHRAGFLMSRVDGEITVEELVDVSGMPRLEALKTLVELLDRGVIAL